MGVKLFKLNGKFLRNADGKLLNVRPTEEVYEKQDELSEVIEAQRVDLESLRSSANQLKQRVDTGQSGSNSDSIDELLNLLSGDY